MFDYYSDTLAADKLKLCYDLATPPVKRYLNQEINFVKQRIKPSDKILELGCGFGRAMKQIYHLADLSIGIDISFHSLSMAREYLGGLDRCKFIQMNAIETGFRSERFDLVFCIQNGISAFHVDKSMLIQQALNLTKAGGITLFSSYSEQFWEHRLTWFEIQSQHGLIGEIDYTKTGNGIIVCKDGFNASTVGCDEFTSLAKACNSPFNICEDSQSSIFCEIKK